jgi:F0F1-type ATP synthase beta subunit
MGIIVSVISYQLTLATDLKDLQEKVPSLKQGPIASVQAINYFV